jgi:hypothetical protein
MSTTDDELKRIQEIALEHAINEMDEANTRGLDTKEDRGDRGFLTGMAAKSLGVAVKIEQFLILRNREGLYNPDDENVEQAKNSLVKNARAEVAEIMKRVKDGPKARSRG